jgi:hypothetical protein
MTAVITTIPGRLSPAQDRARLVCAGGPTLELPWWPDEVESSGLAAGWAETARPGRSPLLTRAAEPLPSLRISFTVSGTTLADSAVGWVDAVRELAKAKPVVQLLLGRSDRGVFRVVDATVLEKEWAGNGDPSVADVTMELRSASDATVPVGPVPKRPKRPGR